MIDPTLETFLLTFDLTQTENDEFLKSVDEIREISNWMQLFSGSALVVTELSITDLGEVLKERFPKQRFLLSNTHKPNRYGWLPRAAWNMINEPEAVK